MSLMSTYKRLPYWLRLCASIFGIVAAIASGWTFLNSVTDTEIRPAWHWELQDLDQSHLELELDFLQSERRYYQDEALQLQIKKRQLEDEDQAVPHYIIEQIRRNEQIINDLNDDIRDTRDKLLEMSR